MVSLFLFTLNIMKRTFLFLTLALFAVAEVMGQKTPKYVFYFIGDGMGMNQVNGTETYLAAREGRIGIKPLLFADFPQTALVTTYSASNGITDSAAGGTALATGRKTYNGALGLLPDSVTPITSLAVWAHDSGAAVGVATSVSVDHATPASFYAHQTYRGKYYAVGQDLIRSGFEFFAGSDFLKPDNPQKGKPDLYAQSRSAGYTIARGMSAFEREQHQADRLILLQTEEASRRDRSSIPYAIDRRPGDMTLTQITRAAIDFLTRKNPERFFCMIEGGKIDWACHANDAATVFEEVIDLDSAIRVAYDFYRLHPDETLIVVTADHETGGIGLGNSNYTLRTDLLAAQRMSSSDYSKHLSALRQEAGNKFNYDLVRSDLQKYFGFWDTVALTEKQEDELQDTYEDVYEGKARETKSMYASENAIAALARRILNENAKLGWTSGQHTNGYVPLFAIGAGSEVFHGRIDNTDVPRLIGKVARYKMP